jgi:hypothetical protein
MAYSPSLSPVSPSPSLSDSSSEDDLQFDQEPSVSRPGSPREGGYANGAAAAATAGAVPDTDTVTCLWEDCGVLFTHLPTLIEHIHKGASVCFFFFFSARSGGESRFDCDENRPYRRAQVKLHLRMGDLFPTESRPNIPFRTHITHPLPYGREAFHLSQTR